MQNIFVIFFPYNKSCLSILFCANLITETLPLAQFCRAVSVFVLIKSYIMRYLDYFCEIRIPDMSSFIGAIF